MTFYLYDKQDNIYCEPLHKVHMPEMAACGFDTKERAQEYAGKSGIKKNHRIRELKGMQEMLTVSAVNDLKVISTDDFQFLPVHCNTELRAVGKNGERSPYKITSRGLSWYKD